MAKIFKDKKIILVFLGLLAANVAIFWQFYFRGLLPFPGDLLVSFFFPWNSGGFPGFDQWTTHKEVIAADVIRQMYPWKSFAFDLIRRGQIPLWNPHNFSGYPLIANLQSSVFFPGNILYLFLPTLWAWVGLLISLPCILMIFMYHFLRSLKLSVLPSILGAIAVANGGYLMVWHEQLIISQVALFLPLVLWCVNQYLATKKVRYLVVFSLAIAGAIFGGHAQTFIYLIVIVFAYLIFRRSLRTFLPFLVLGLVLGAVQLLPSLEIYLQSAREGAVTRSLFAPFVLPWQSLVTIFAPDFFGNPATGNFWGRYYGDFQVYFGVVALTLACLAVWTRPSRPETKFFLFLGLVGMLFALWPLAFVPHLLNIPIVATGVPTRVMFIFHFSMAVLAAFGLELVLARDRNIHKEIRPLLLVAAVYLLLWLVVLVNRTPEMAVAQKNLVLPTLTYFLVAAAVFLSARSGLRKYALLASIVVVTLAIGEYSYLFNKYQPFASAKFVFPPHPVWRFLQDQAGIDRFFGFGTAYVDNNLATYYRVFATEGYDSLFIKRYGELLASAKDGHFPKEIRRSDAVFPPNDNYYRNRLFDLLGVKYILDKNDNPATNWEEETDKFPLDRYQLIWQSYKWKAYERKTALPRAFLVGNYIVEKSPQAILDKLYDPKFNLKETVILEKDPGLNLARGGSGSVRILAYEPNTLRLKVETDGNKLLFISDSYYPGWRAFVSGDEIPIYRADYQFRAVPVPAGSHLVSFVYDPWSFKLGLAISGLALLALVFSALTRWKIKNVS